MDQIKNAGGRKFVFAFLSAVLSFVLVVMGKVSAENWFTFMGVIGATYVIGNVTSKLVGND